MTEFVWLMSSPRWRFNEVPESGSDQLPSSSCSIQRPGNQAKCSPVAAARTPTPDIVTAAVEPCRRPRN